MMEQLEMQGALPDFDTLDVDLDNSGGFELGSGDFDALLGGDAKNDKFLMKDSDIDNLMNEGIPEEGPNDFSANNIDHLKTMPIAEIDQADAILGLEPAAKDTQDFEPEPIEAQAIPQQWNQQQQGGVQQNDSLLGTCNHLRSDNNNMMPQSSGSIQMIVDQGLQQQQQAANNGMLPHMGQNSGVNVADLQDEKQKLLDRLREINMREDPTSNGFQQPQQHQQQHQQMRAPNNGFVLQRNEHVPQPVAQSGNMFLQDQTPFSAPAPVASVGGLGGGGETPLSAFLRGSRKSQNQPPRPAASVLSQNISGAPKAASIFSQLPMDLEAITSQSELQASNSFLQQNEPKSHLFASMDRSVVSQEMVRKLSSRSIARQNSGRNKIGGNVGNASWGMDGGVRKSGGFRTSGILSKSHASESHLVRKGGLSMSHKSSKGSLSRENALYSLMKRNSSKNLIRRDDSQGSLLAAKRRVGSKHKLSLSRSVPALVANNNGGGSMSQGSKNALW